MKPLLKIPPTGKEIKGDEPNSLTTSSSSHYHPDLGFLPLTLTTKLGCVVENYR